MKASEKRKEIIKGLINLRKKLNRAPDKKDIEDSDIPALINYSVGYYFSSLITALKKAGIDNPTENELLNHLAELFIKKEGNLKEADLKKEKIYTLEEYEHKLNLHKNYHTFDWLINQASYHYYEKNKKILPFRNRSIDILELKKKEKKEKKLKIIGSFIDEFLRCEYRLDQSIKENKLPIELLSSEYIKTYVIQPGVDFEEKVMAKFNWKKSELSLDQLMKSKVLIQKPRIVIDKDSEIKNIFQKSNVEEGWKEEINNFSSITQLIGEPDIIAPKSDIYVPIDIKHHKEVNRMDRLRITFYALLLKSKFNYEKLPKGYVLLKNNKISVVDTINHVNEVLRILIRIYRNFKSSSRYVEPRLCVECQSCKLKEQCIDYLKKKGGLTLVHQVGPRNEEKLKQAGIENIDQLAKKYPHEIENLDLRSFYGSRTPEIICASARAIHYSKEVRFGNGSIPMKKTEVYLDLEYTDTPFCYGILVKKNNKLICNQFFEDSKAFDNFILNLIKAENDFVLYTFAGESADMPFFNNKDYKNLLLEKHIDIYRFICKNFAFPLQSYSEKELAEYFNLDIENNTPIKDGFECLIAYSRYCNSTGKEKERIKKEILEYNKSDLLGLLKIKNIIAQKIVEIPLEYGHGS